MQLYSGDIRPLLGGFGFHSSCRYGILIACFLTLTFKRCLISSSKASIEVKDSTCLAIDFIFFYRYPVLRLVLK